VANELGDVVDYAHELFEISVSGKQNSAMHDAVAQPRKVIQPFVFLIAEVSANSLVQKRSPWCVFSERVIDLMELQFIYETISAHFPTGRLESFSDLLKNRCGKVKSAIVGDAAAVLCKDISG
jgi:hypothetical protein